jgi:predicted small metal-binding protein
MAITFPTTLDQLINPSGTDSVQLVSHAAQHSNANDAIEALEAKLGVDNSTDIASIDYKVRDLISKIYTNELAQDAIAAALAAGTHTNITVGYNDVANSLSLTATYDDEEVMDAIATSLTSGTGITKVYDDVANTITVSVDTTVIATKQYVDTAVSSLSNTASTTYVPLSLLGQADGVAELDENGFVPASQLSIDEKIQDVAAKLITDGTHYNISVSYNDTNATLSLSANYDDEEVMDAIATSLTAGNGITKTYDDVANTITLAVDTSVMANKTYVDTAISNLVDAAPGLLDTLNEIAAAIGDDANFVTTITTALATKLNITTAASTYLALTDTDERIQDVVGGMVAGNTESTGLAVTYDDPTGKLNFEITTADLPGFTEAAQDSVSALFTHAGHTNVTATYDDVANKINLAVTAQLTQEQAQDYIAPLFTHGLNPNITATYDDATNRLILETIIPPSKAIMSASAPASPADGTFWFDTDEYRSGNTWALKVWQTSTSSWQYVSSDLSLSTTNTWTSKNTYTNGVIIGLDAAPLTPVHGQIYYNKPLDKLKVWDGLLWQDIQGSGGGGGLTLIPTDATAAPSTFFVGLIAPPSGATTNGDLWIDVDDIDTPFNQFYTGGVSPDPAQYEFWVDNVEPIQELIYSANEPGTPSYPGELWIDTDDYDGAIVEFGATAPNPNNVQLWVDINENESPSYYKDLTFTNYATVADFPANAPNGFVASDASSGLAYVRSQGQWLAIVTASNINTIISSNSTVFEDLKALAWMGFE